MKNLIFLFGFILFLASCTESNITPVTKESSIPIYVQQFQPDSTSECFYKIDSKTSLYLVSSKTNQVVEQISKKDIAGTLFIIGMGCGCFLISLIYAWVID